SLALTFAFPGGVSGQMATVRAMPLFFRVHVFGTRGSAEVRGETELTVRIGAAAPRRFDFAPIESQRAELEAFADAVAGRAPFPVTPAQMLDTVAAFQSVIEALRS
ncbi:MAG TPA: hypothetical protein VKE95_19705, partial [Burkholderiales bacterium]|nr:hypothetical protein [Burkholderiales bacterium]